jgi:hypothetical protein
MAFGPGPLDIGGKEIFGFVIPKIKIGSAIKGILGPPETNIQEEIANTVQKGVMVPILIGAGTIALAIVIVAWMNSGKK